MSKCEEHQKLLDAYVLGMGDLDPLDLCHLEDCPRCMRARSDADSLRTMVQAYAGEIGNRAEVLLESGALEMLSVLPEAETQRSGRNWMWIGVAAAVLIASLIGIFRMEPSVRSSREGRFYLEALERESTRADVVRYLSSTENLLLSVLYSSEGCGSAPSEIQAQKQIAQRLILQKRMLDPKLASPLLSDVKPLFDEVELILLNVAGSDECLSREHVAALRGFIESRHTLMKLNMMQMEDRI